MHVYVYQGAKTTGSFDGDRNEAGVYYREPGPPKPKQPKRPKCLDDGQYRL